MTDVQPGTLHLCGTPIGNVGDAGPRLSATLLAVDVIAAEDTRRIRRLASDLGLTLTARIVSTYDANEAARAEWLVTELQAGRSVALVTDAGMPAVSDPGYRVVAACVLANLPVTVVPGPSSVTSALAVSGLPSDRWVFEGFLPRKAGERRSRLAQLADETRTLVFLEAPHRTQVTLEAMVDAFGVDRRAVVARELTKTYEEVLRGSVTELAAWAAGGVRGEVTLVVAGAAPAGAGPVSDDDLAAAVEAREVAGATRKEAIAAEALVRGIPKKVVYAAVVAQVARAVGPLEGG